jgi:hypothetical protein
MYPPTESGFPSERAQAYIRIYSGTSKKRSISGRREASNSMVVKWL